MDSLFESLVVVYKVFVKVSKRKKPLKCKGKHSALK